MLAKVSIRGPSSEQFSVHTGVKQGCVLTPVLFNIYLVAVTLLSRHSHYNSPCSSLHRAYSCLGLDINPNKTEVIQTAFKRRDPAAQLHIDNLSLSNVNSFIYLGSVISDNGHTDEDILRWINLASNSFGRLRLRVFSNSNHRLTTKVAVYRSVVRTPQGIGSAGSLSASPKWRISRRDGGALRGGDASVICNLPIPHRACFPCHLNLSFADRAAISSEDGRRWRGQRCRQQ
ncbi:unnamed protein product [Acanthosepion pharaonis]|uniref:Reverse transcriptase domain-containing protein n=1 Tax=Acanthosepion pharaonis TaxID=158019 RepID=A0A812AMJ3_ACAPH|nr:unnamed protein product [Sepia pharaonis]